MTHKHPFLSSAVLAFLIYWALTGTAAGQNGDTAEQKQPQVTTTLGSIGYPDGVFFDATSAPQSYTLRFPLPRDTAVIGGSFDLTYRASPTLTQHDALVVTINDRPVKSESLILDGHSHVWHVPLDLTALFGQQVKVTIKGNIAVGYDNCQDMQPVSGRLHVAPTTALTYTYAGTPSTLRDSWLLLPQQVTLSLPAGSLDAPLFQSALDWITLLQKSHHTVRVVRLPQLGEMVIAPAEQISEALGNNHQLHWAEQGANIGLFVSDHKSVIALTTPYASASRFAAQQDKLISPSFIKTEPEIYTDKRLEIPIADYGVASSFQELARKVEWKAIITPWSLPSGTQPRVVNLNIDLPNVNAKELLRLYAYIDGRLIVAQHLIGKSGMQHVSIPFDVRHSGSSYHLRIVAHRGAGSDCTKPDELVPIRITDDSHLTVESDDSFPQNFSALPGILGSGFDVYIPRSYLHDADNYLPFVSRVLDGFSRLPDNYTLKVYDTPDTLIPQRPFIAFGNQVPRDAAAELRYDQGAITLTDNEGHTLLNELQLRELSTLQVLELNDMPGVWVHAGAKVVLPQFDALLLGTDNLAFFEPTRLMLTISSHQEDLVQLHYTEAPRWYERLHDHRFILLAVMWLLVTAGVLYLYTKSKQHRGS